MSPAAIRTVGEPGFALSSSFLQVSNMIDKRVDPRPPCSMRPAPSDRICGPQQRLCPLPRMRVHERPCETQVANSPKKDRLVVPAKTLVLLDDDTTNVRLGTVRDEGSQTVGPCLHGMVGRIRDIDRCPDVRAAECVDDRTPPPFALTREMQMRLLGQQELSEVTANLGQVVAIHPDPDQHQSLSLGLIDKHTARPGALLDVDVSGWHAPRLHEVGISYSFTVLSCPRCARGDPRETVAEIPGFA